MAEKLSQRFHRAITSNDVAEAIRVLGEGMDPNGEVGLWLPLMSAIERGRHEIIRVLVEYGADIQIQTSDGDESAWYVAVECALRDPSAPNWSTIELLLELGGDVESLRAAGLAYAEWHGPRYWKLFSEFIAQSESP